MQYATILASRRIRSIELKAGFMCTEEPGLAVRPADFTLRVRADGSLLVRHRYDLAWWEDGSQSIVPGSCYRCPEPLVSLLFTLLTLTMGIPLSDAARETHGPWRGNLRSVVVYKEYVRHFFQGLLQSPHPWVLILAGKPPTPAVPKRMCNSAFAETTGVHRIGGAPSVVC